MKRPCCLLSEQSGTVRKEEDGKMERWMYRWMNTRMDASKGEWTDGVDRQMGDA